MAWCSNCAGSTEFSRGQIQDGGQIMTYFCQMVHKSVPGTKRCCGALVGPVVQIAGSTEFMPMVKIQDGS